MTLHFRSIASFLAAALSAVVSVSSHAELVTPADFMTSEIPKV